MMGHTQAGRGAGSAGWRSPFRRCWLLVGAKGLESLAPLGPHGPVIMGCGCAGTAWLFASLGVA